MKCVIQLAEMGIKSLVYLNHNPTFRDIVDQVSLSLCYPVTSPSLTLNRALFRKSWKEFCSYFSSCPLSTRGRANVWLLTKHRSMWDHVISHSNMQGSGQPKLIFSLKLETASFKKPKYPAKTSIYFCQKNCFGQNRN